MIATISQAIARLFDTPLNRIADLTIGQIIVLAAVFACISWAVRK